MYIAELDRPWTDTPFMFQGFHLRTDQQLQALKKFCKHVFVDVEKTELEDRSRARALPSFKIRGNAVYPETVNVETEVQRAAPVYAQTVAAVNELLRPLTQGSTVLEGREVKDSVTRLTDSVVRNPDALLLVSKLREKSAAAHARALQVSIYMIVFARFLELAREELELLGLLGLLQDVGKTQLPVQGARHRLSLRARRAIHPVRRRVPGRQRGRAQFRRSRHRNRAEPGAPPQAARDGGARRPG